MGNIILLFAVLGLFYMVFVSPVICTIGLTRMGYPDCHAPTNALMPCFIPYYNWFYGWSKYAGHYRSFIGLSQIILTVAVILRVVVMYNMTLYMSDTVQIVTVIFLLVSVLFYGISNFVTIFIVMKDSGCYRISSIIIHSFLIVTGQFIIGFTLPAYVYKYTSNGSKGGNSYGGIEL